jgi:hypothetical protein
MLQAYVSIVSDVSEVCCKSRLRCAHVAYVLDECCKCIVPNVSVVSDVCYTCFIWVLHMFHTYVASVSSDVAYVSHMVQVFHLDVAYVLQWLYICFPGVSNVCCKCFNCSGRMLQVFHLDFVKVDLVLHIL